MRTNEKINWEFPISIPSNPFKRKMKSLSGKLALTIIPSIRKNLLNGKIPENRIERAALTSIFIELQKTNQLEKLAELHKKIWASNDNQGYYEITSSRQRDMFELMKDNIYSSINTQILNSDIQELIEVGCGKGVIINSLSKKYKKNIDTFIGIDINEKQIQLNKETYKSNKNLKFFVEDFTKQLDSIKGPEKIYLTFGGVLEYLTEKELLAYFSELSKLKNSTIILYEPIQAGFDTKKEHHSITYGSELSLSHPYHYYLKNSGFEIFSESFTPSNNANWIYIAAKNN